MATGHVGKDAARAAGLSKSGNRNFKETVIAGLLFVCAAISILTTLAVIFALTEETISFFREVSVLEFFHQRPVDSALFREKLRHRAARRGHATRNQHRPHRRLTARSRLSHLPLGVCRG